MISYVGSLAFTGFLVSFFLRKSTGHTSVSPAQAISIWRQQVPGRLGSFFFLSVHAEAVGDPPRSLLTFQGLSFPMWKRCYSIAREPFQCKYQY